MVKIEVRYCSLRVHDEGCAMRISDIIAYVKDRQDALRAGAATEETLFIDLGEI